MSTAAPDPVEEAHDIARRHGLRIKAAHAADGQVVAWRVYRIVAGRPVFVGQRHSGRGLLGLVLLASQAA